MEYKLREKGELYSFELIYNCLEFELSEFKFKVACLKCNCKLYGNYSNGKRK